MTNIISPIDFDESLINHNCIYFSVPDEPVAKQRPRAARKGRYITIYTPRETKNYEKKVEKYYREIYDGCKLEGPLEVTIEGTFGIPNSASKKLKTQMLEGLIPHTKKPDCDNMAKTPLDALNGIAYDDDSQIVKLNVSKKYGESSKLDILIKEINLVKG